MLAKLPGRRRPEACRASASGERRHRPATNGRISPSRRQRTTADAEQSIAAEPNCRIIPLTRRVSIRVASDGRLGQTRRVTASFIPGLQLASLYYAELVRPLLDEEFPGLRYTAARIGRGSEVLGLDSARSTDHDWGPRLQLFVPDDDEAADLCRRVTDMLRARLPAAFRGYPTVFPRSGHPGAPASHRITVAGLRQWLSRTLGFDPALPVGLPDWLSAPTQVLAEITGGEVFHDGLADSDGSDEDPAPGGLGAVRTALAWYPTDIWLYVMACQWQRIAQEEAFPGRCAESGDDLGSAVITARLARDLMRLVLLMQRRYPPYSKWLGTAVARTAAADQLLPALRAAVSAASWPDRERAMSAAYEAAARLHNTIGVTPHLDPAVRPRYFDRPYAVLEAGRFVRALRDQISTEEVRQLPLTGAVDQFIDSTDAIGDSALRRAAVRSSVLGGNRGKGPA